MTFTTIDPGDENNIAGPFYSSAQDLCVTLVRGGDVRPIPTSSKERISIRSQKDARALTN